MTFPASKGYRKETGRGRHGVKMLLGKTRISIPVHRKEIAKGTEAMKLHVMIHHDDQGIYWGECAELPGCFSQGATPDDLMGNMKEAVGLYLEGMEARPEADGISEIRELVV
jgi:predicted RNase H-like HicB family nuclease